MLNLNKEILGTNILRVNEKMSFEIEQYRNKLFDLWTELEKTEQKLYIIEMKSQLLVQEYKNTLETAHSSSVSIKNQTYSDFNVLVSDDCSPHDLKSIYDEVCGDDAQFSYPRNEVNMGNNSLVSVKFVSL